MRYYHSQNCALNSPTMFRNVCVLALVVLCGQAASAFSTDMIMGMASKMAGQAMSMGMTCLKKNKADDVMASPTPAKIVHSGGCLAGCAMEKVGLMKDGGKIDTSSIAKHIPASMPMADKMQQILKDCGGKGGDTCSSPLSFAKCVCTDGPMKEMLDATKAMISALVMEIVKAAM